jgi:uncharacterized membrane protein
MKEKFKLDAKSYLNGNWPEIIIVTIIVLLLTSVSSSDSWLGYESGSFKVGLSGGLGQVFSLIVSGPLAYGYFYFLKSIKNRSGEISQVFVGFSERFKETFIAHLITTMFVVLWALLLIIPGIIAAISYSMVYLILLDNPNMNAYQAIQESKRMMSGNKMRYFEFVISFAGWFFLGILTLGIGLLYLKPYFDAAKIEFYEDLKNQSTRESFVVN